MDLSILTDHFGSCQDVSVVSAIDWALKRKWGFCAISFWKGSVIWSVRLLVLWRYEIFVWLRRPFTAASSLIIQ